MNKEIIETIKNVKTADELKDVASKNGYNLTVEEAKGYFDLYHNNGKVNEEELDNVTGGSSCIGGKSYSDNPHGYLIVTLVNCCDGYVNDPDAFGFGKNCNTCKFCVGDGYDNSPTIYCSKRNRWDDPYNDTVGTKRKASGKNRYWDDNGVDHL